MTEGLIATSEALLEAAYRAEFVAPQPDPGVILQVEGRTITAGELRSLALVDLATRMEQHSLLRRADDTARLAALRFVERRLTEGNKIDTFDQSGNFHGFLRRVLHNLLLDWLRSPAGKAELRRAEHLSGDGDPAEDPLPLPHEEFEARRRKTLHYLVAIRAIQGLPPGRGIPLRLALWPDYELDLAEISEVASFAFCHETASNQAEGRACDAGRRCPIPPQSWSDAYRAELEQAQKNEPHGLSRRTIAELTRIGRDKPMPKREGALCERISKGRLQLIEELRRVGIRGTP
ncbi:MAG: hypothetical protein RMJ98_03575 [Myxococcales bacterium]|nr:hypothetical protein [Polyangiaceae bacterium]MDW8248369.1 hypothetical protein [Myxococcales bacterium]